MGRGGVKGDKGWLDGVREGRDREGGGQEEGGRKGEEVEKDVGVRDDE